MSEPAYDLGPALQKISDARLDAMLCTPLRSRPKDHSVGNVYIYIPAQEMISCAKLCPLCSAISHQLSRFGYPLIPQAEDLTIMFRKPAVRGEYRLGAIVFVKVPPSPEYTEILALWPPDSSLAWRPIWQGAKKDKFDRALPIVSHWLEECKAKHKSCARSWSLPHILPRRLLDVGVHGEHIHLVESSDLNGSAADKPYTALSYCWGIEKVLKTERANYDQFLVQIPFEDLPKTIRDAIDFTKKLGLRYLWVDSLCIIQDDRNDWACESLKMAAVYQNAYLTLMASSSKGADESLWPLTDSDLIVTDVQPDTSSDHAINDGVIIRAQGERASAWQKLIYHAEPTASRAWIFQELALSHRILHFTSDQLLWQCGTTTVCEHGLWHNGLYAPGDIYNGDYFSVWKTWVQDYSRRRLTNPEDRFAAFAGVVKFVQELSGFEPCAGLWVDFLPLELLWRYHDLRTFEQTPAIWKDVPSWTWTKQPGRIDYTFLVEHAVRNVSPEKSLHAAVLESFNLVWTERPLVSIPRAGQLCLKARLLSATVGILEEALHHKECIELSAEHVKYLHALEDPDLTCAPEALDGYITIDGKWTMERCYIFPDNDGPENGTSIMLLDVASYIDNEFMESVKRLRHSFLWVKLAADGNLYRRLGAGCVNTNFDLFAMSQIVDVTLV